MKYMRFFALLLSLCLLAGCSIVPFQTPEEQRAAQEAAEALKREAQTQADPFTALDSAFTLKRTLTNSAGATLATYEVAFPKFSENGEKAQSFARINNYYENEITGLIQDAYSFFGEVKKVYGEATTSWWWRASPTMTAMWSYRSWKPPRAICASAVTSTWRKTARWRNTPRPRSFCWTTAGS